MKTGESMSKTELLETIVISVAVLSLLPVAYWWHMKTLAAHRLYFGYLLIMLSLMGYITYRRIKRLRAALKASKKGGQGRPMPPFFQ
ncbi:hypothetical protein ACFL6S_25710 [Candidatus Poribacteria bacterium]